MQADPDPLPSGGVAATSCRSSTSATEHHAAPSLAGPRELETHGTQRLAPVFGPRTALLLVVGAMIGSGVFLKANVVAGAMQGSLAAVLLLWIGCGLVNLCGALTLAELAVLMPHAGGTYVYLREAYGRLWAFLWGWSELLVIRSGAIAALAVGMTISAEFLLADLAGLPFNPLRQCLLATLAIAGLAGVTVLGTVAGGRLQSATTWLKIGFTVGVALLPWLPNARPEMPVQWLPADDGICWLQLGAALSGIMWAYDGWGNLGVVAEEVRDPARSIPWALTGGVWLTIVLYAAVNLAYHQLLPWRAIADAAVPAQAATAVVWPAWGPRLINAVLLISMFGALQANVLMGPRVLFAMARDGAFFRVFGRISPRFGTPAAATIGTAGWSIALIWLSLAAQGLGSASDAPWGLPIAGRKPLFDILTDYCIFGGSVFYLTAVAAVFVFRRTRADRPRPYRTWGYPWTPLVFLAAYVLLLGSMLISSPRESLTALLFTAAGGVIYLLAFREPAGRAGKFRDEPGR